MANDFFQGFFSSVGNRMAEDRRREEAARLEREAESRREAAQKRLALFQDKIAMEREGRQRGQQVDDALIAQGINPADIDRESAPGVLAEAARGSMAARDAAEREKAERQARLDALNEANVRSQIGSRQSAAEQTKEGLISEARRLGIVGAHAMSKEQLNDAIAEKNAEIARTAGSLGAAGAGGGRPTDRQLQSIAAVRSVFGDDPALDQGKALDIAKLAEDIVTAQLQFMPMATPEEIVAMRREAIKIAGRTMGLGGQSGSTAVPQPGQQAPRIGNPANDSLFGS